MEAAIKYEVEVARELCAKTLVQPNFLKSDPFTVFAIAYRFRLSHETRLIAKSARRFSELPKDFPVARIETFPAKALWVLMEYRTECQRIMHRFGENNEGMADNELEGLRGPLYTPCYRCDPHGDCDTVNLDVYRHDLQGHLQDKFHNDDPDDPDSLVRSLVRVAAEQHPCKDCQYDLILLLGTFHRDVLAALNQRLDEVELSLGF